MPCLRPRPAAAAAGAAFVEAWYPAPPIPFADRKTLSSEVQAYHADHQFASNNAIGEIAAVLWRHVDAPRFQSALDDPPGEAAEFWETDG